MGAPTSPTLHRLAPGLYDRLVSGLLGGEAVELIDGLLVHVTPQGAEHAALVRYLLLAFVPRADLLRVRMPLAVPGGRPEPDLALAHDAGPREHPRTAELVVEVAVSSWYDDLAKLPGYADAGVKAVWVLDVPARAVHVFDEPDGRRYRRERVLAAGDTLVAPIEGVPPLALPTCLPCSTPESSSVRPRCGQQSRGGPPVRSRSRSGELPGTGRGIIVARRRRRVTASTERRQGWRVGQPPLRVVEQRVGEVQSARRLARVVGVLRGWAEHLGAEGGTPLGRIAIGVHSGAPRVAPPGPSRRQGAELVIGRDQQQRLG